MKGTLSRVSVSIFRIIDQFHGSNQEVYICITRQKDLENHQCITRRYSLKVLDPVKIAISWYSPINNICGRSCNNAAILSLFNAPCLPRLYCFQEPTTLSPPSHPPNMVELKRSVTYGEMMMGKPCGKMPLSPLADKLQRFLDWNLFCILSLPRYESRGTASGEP